MYPAPSNRYKSRTCRFTSRPFSEQPGCLMSRNYLDIQLSDNIGSLCGVDGCSGPSSLIHHRQGEAHHDLDTRIARRLRQNLTEHKLPNGHRIMAAGGM